MKRLLALSLALPLVAQAQRLPAENPKLLAPPYMEAMSWVDIRDAIRGGKKVAVIATGGVEQNGPHMTLGKHNDIITFAAGMIAAQLNGLVAPTVKWVPEGNIPRANTSAQPGTITNPMPHFQTLLIAAARSLKVHGFTEILLIGDSGGNQMGLSRTADSLNKVWADSGVKVFALNEYYARARQENNALMLKELGVTCQQIGTHAGMMDTSQLMYVNPDAVRTENIRVNGGAGNSGVRGDPTKASAELGKRLLENKVSAAVRQYRQIKAGTPAEPIPQGC
jgi:creatinine amidohydrolase